MSEFDPSLVESLREDLGEVTEATIARALDAARVLALRWGVDLEGWLPGGTCSLVLTGRRDEREVVVRAPLLPWEIGASLPALRAFSGNGGVEVLRFDESTGTTLLPRLRPGDDLSLVEEESAIGLFADLVRRLHRAEGTAPSVASYLRPVLDGELAVTAAQMRTDPVALAYRLLESSPPPRLLHGDAHHFNILLHGSAWVAIDPEGVSGDPAYECAAFLRNPIPQIGADPDLVATLYRRIVRLAELLDHSPERIWGWGLVRTAQCVDDPTADPDHPWVRVLEALDELSEEFGRRI